MSLSVNFPSVAPSLNLDFAGSERLDPRITFTRATTARYYDGVTTAKAEENLLVQSQDFTTTWSGSNLTRTSNTGDTTAPDGTSTATKVDINATTGTAKWIRQAQDSLPNVVLSFFLKAGTHGIFQIYAEGSSQNFCNFDVGSGTVGSAGTNATGSIVSVGNSWYRCIVVFGSTGASRAYLAVVDSDTAGYGSTTTIANAYFYAWGAQREQRSAVTAYTPTTTQPITNYIPVLLTAAAGVARFDHTPTTGTSLGLLIEEQRANLYVRSDDFANASWSKVNATIDSNTVIAPDGTLTGDKIVEAVDTSQPHYAFQTVAVTTGTAYTVSCYVKSAGRTNAAIRFFATNSAFSGGFAYFDLANGVVGIKDASITTFTITAVGNGWYRISATSTSTATANANTAIYSIETLNTVNNNGNGYSGIFIWGAQLEVGSFPTSYIPTGVATATRNADVATMTGTNFSSWYNATEGTLFVDYIRADGQTNDRWLANIYIDSNNRFELITGSTIRARSVISGVPASAGTFTSATTGKYVGAYKASDYAGSFNGAATLTNTGISSVITGTAFSIANPGYTSAPLNGYIKRIAYYPSRLTNEQLVALTR